jgi:5,10-methylenetetrahydromethanopterin reductase
MEFWRVGQTSPLTIATDAPALESAGWDGMVIADSQCIVGDSYVALALAARETSTLKLGVGVTNPVTRHPSVTASAAAGLQAMSGGRMTLGIGRGDSSLAHVGLAPASPATFERYVRNVQTYLGGGAVAFDDLDRGSHRPSSELGGAGIPEDSRLRWLSPKAPKVPVDVAASGPAIIGVAARHAERVTFGVGADHARLQWAIDSARAARAQAGLDPNTLGIGAYLNLVAHPDQSIALALAATGVTMFSRFCVLHGKVSGPASDATRANFDRVGGRYDLREHGSGDAKHRDAVDDEHIASFGIVGTPDQVVDRLVALNDLGLDRVLILGGFAGASAEAAEQLAVSRDVLAREVFPAVREKVA